MTERIPHGNQHDAFEKNKREIKANIMHLLVEPLKVSNELILHDYSDDEIDAAAHIIAVCTRGDIDRKVTLEDTCVRKGLNIIAGIYEEQISHQPHLRKEAETMKEKFLQNVKTLIGEYPKLIYYNKYGKWEDIGSKD